MKSARLSWFKRIEAHLVSDWRRAHKWASMRWAVALLAIIELQEYLPGVKEYLPEKWVKWMAVAIIIARLLKGRNTPPAVPPPTKTE